MSPFRSGRMLPAVLVAGVVALAQTADTSAMTEEHALEHAKQYQKQRCGDSGRKCLKALAYGPWCNLEPPGKGRGQWGCYGYSQEGDARGLWGCETWDAWSRWGNLIPGSGHKSCFPPSQNWRRR